MEIFCRQTDAIDGVTPPWSVPPSLTVCRLHCYCCSTVVAHAIAIFSVLWCVATWCVVVCWDEDELQENLNQKGFFCGASGASIGGVVVVARRSGQQHLLMSTVQNLFWYGRT
jgi:hypothetical protein